MAAGDLVTLPWQLELNGLLMGDSTDFVVREVDLWAAPALRPSEAARAATHGLMAGIDLLGGRQVALSLYVTGTTDSDEATNRQSLAAAFMPSSDGTPVPLVWMEDDGSIYRLVGKPRLADPRVAPRMPTECRFLATDPRIYANAEQTATTPLGTTSGGLDFAATAPFVFGTAGSSSVMACANDGTFPAPWVATFTGPLTAPELVQIGSGKRIILSGADLAAGETLTVDSDARTVLLNGTASRYSWLSSASEWFDLDPGPNSVQLLGSAGSGTVTLTWRSAWI